MNFSLKNLKLSSRLASQIKYKSLKQMTKGLIQSKHPYFCLARLSQKPRKKLCDFTSLPATYTCPRTYLRFFDLSVYKFLSSLSSEVSEKYYDNKMYGKDARH